MIVNVRPLAVSVAPTELLWQGLTTPDRFGEWL